MTDAGQQGMAARSNTLRPVCSMGDQIYGVLSMSEDQPISIREVRFTRWSLFDGETHQSEERSYPSTQAMPTNNKV